MNPAVSYPLKGKRVFVAGHSGMVGSALVRRLEAEDCEILTVSHGDLDLRRQADVDAWFAAHRPEAVFHAAGTVGGILANASRPAEFLYDNLAMGGNLIEAARRFGVEKLLFLGSSCIYPKFAPQPIGEEALLTGPLEDTNAWYAIAKIAGIKLIEAYRSQYGSEFISVMPTNLYGPGDNFALNAAHVLPALMRKAHDAKEAGESVLEVWGSGRPRREFLHVDDLADACIFVMRHHSGAQFLNIGTGSDISIADLAMKIAAVVGFEGALRFDSSKPDGTPRKLLNSERLTQLGWKATIGLDKGLAKTYDWFVSHLKSLRR
jgi:GDP-L-fucose synthase